MNDNDKKLISEYMGWNIVMVGPQKSPYPIYVDNIDSNIHHRFDLNDAGLCVSEMQKRGEFHSFLMMDTFNQISSWSDFIADLFNAENFFAAMAAYLKEGKK